MCIGCIRLTRTHFTCGGLGSNLPSNAAIIDAKTFHIRNVREAIGSRIIHHLQVHRTWWRNGYATPLTADRAQHSYLISDTMYECDDKKEAKNLICLKTNIELKKRNQKKYNNNGESSKNDWLNKGCALCCVHCVRRMKEIMKWKIEEIKTKSNTRRRSSFLTCHPCAHKCTRNAQHYIYFRLFFLFFFGRRERDMVFIQNK